MVKALGILIWDKPQQYFKLGRVINCLPCWEQTEECGEGASGEPNPCEKCEHWDQGDSCVVSDKKCTYYKGHIYFKVSYILCRISFICSYLQGHQSGVAGLGCHCNLAVNPASQRLDTSRGCSLSHHHTGHYDHWKHIDGSAGYIIVAKLHGLGSPSLNVSRVSQHQEVCIPLCHFLISAVGHKLNDIY